MNVQERARREYREAKRLAELQAEVAARTVAAAELARGNQAPPLTRKLTWTKGEAHVVGARVDWVTFSARVDVSVDVLALLRERGRVATREEAPQPFVLGRYEGRLQLAPGAQGARAFRLFAPGRDGKWMLQNDLMRLTVLERGAGAVAELAATAATGARPLEVGWSVQVEMSGTALLAMGFEGAILEAWKVSELLGDVYECRFGRLDVCADVAGYDLREDDHHSFVKTSRVKWGSRFHDGRVRTSRRRRRSADGSKVELEETSWHQDGRKIVDDDDAGQVLSYVGDTFTGFAFGLARTSVSGRIYDKVLELRTPKKGARYVDSSKRQAEFAEWQRNGWLGPDEEPAVTRIEFETRGDALNELGLRCATRPETGGAKAMVETLRAALDPAWAYFTQKWLRLVRRGTPDIVQPRWREVQAVTFVTASLPRRRIREHGGAKAPQSLGTALSLLASCGDLPAVPWRPKVNETTGEVDPYRFDVKDPKLLVDELFPTSPSEEEREERARAHLALVTQTLMRRAGARIAKCSLERYGSARDALSNVFGKWGAAMARFPHATDVWLHEGAGQTGPSNATAVA